MKQQQKQQSPPPPPSPASVYIWRVFEYTSTRYRSSAAPTFRSVSVYMFDFSVCCVSYCLRLPPTHSSPPTHSWHFRCEEQRRTVADGAQAKRTNGGYGIIMWCFMYTFVNRFGHYIRDPIHNIRNVNEYIILKVFAFVYTHQISAS